MAGDEGFEPPILGPEPSALPLGQSPTVMMNLLIYMLRIYSEDHHRTRKMEYILSGCSFPLAN
jgi:hypothetical protein